MKLWYSQHNQYIHWYRTCIMSSQLLGCVKNLIFVMIAARPVSKHKDKTTVHFIKEDRNVCSIMV
jgi:hypothetical protein